MSILKFSYLWSARKRQWSKAEPFERYRWQMLLKSLTSAYENIGFYRRLFDRQGISVKKIRCMEDFRKIPLLTKETVKLEFGKKTIFDHQYLKTCVSRTTSGSCGFPLTVYYDRRSYFHSEAIYARALFEQGVRLTDRIAYFWYEPFKKRGFWEYWGLFRKNEILYTQDERSQVEQLIKLNPTVIHCFPSNLYVLGQIFGAGANPLKPRLIITHGELLQDCVKKEIERIFKAPVLDQYGSNEFNRMAWQCREYGNYHIDADNVLIEFLDAGNNEVKGSARGRLVVTHLENRMMPLIRYEIGDYAVKLDKPCPCGRNLPLLEKLEGRQDDFIFLKGRLISPRKLGGSLEQVKSLKWYHFVQLDENKFKMEIMPNELFNEDERCRLREVIKSVLAQDIELEIKIADKYERTNTGKMRAIVSYYKEPAVCSS
jgi:phenylacetate-CoA ligase